MKRDAVTLLECALHLALAPTRDDATAPILARWRAGERGDPGALASEAVPHTPARRGRWLLAGAAAAAVIALAVATGRGNEGLARATGPVTVLRPGALHAERRTRVDAGDTVVVDAGATAQLALADGTRLELGPRTLLVVGERDGVPHLTARVGSLRVERAGGHPLLLGTALGTIEAGPQARLTLTVEPADYTIPFPRLVQEIHMHMHALAFSTTITLLAGSAHLLEGARVDALVPGRTVQSPAPVADPCKDLLFAELGMWDLEFTDHLRGSDKTVRFRGSETCTAGPGREWLLVDMTYARGKGEVSAHFVLGFSARHQRYFGSLVDSFGGGMEVFEGTPGADPKCRVLTSRLQGGNESTRTTMRWTGPDERHTLFEVRDGESWVKIRDIVHRRRK